MRDLISHLRSGGLCIVVDDEDRENEGDFVGLGQTISYQSLNLMVTRGRGLICVPIGQERARTFGLGAMAKTNTDPHGTAFTVSVDSMRASTGISVGDRLETIRDLAAPDPLLIRFRSPGHMFPLIGRPGGLGERRGHTEAALELARLAGTTDCAVICEILADDGTMLRYAGLAALAEQLQIPFLTLDEIMEVGHVLG